MKSLIIVVVVCLALIAVAFYADDSTHEQATEKFTYERVKGPSMNNKAYIVTEKETGTRWLMVDKYGAVALDKKVGKP